MSRYKGQDFDKFIRRLVSTWEFALELQKEWHTFDGEERLGYTEDWPIYNDIHQDLADYVAEHELTEDRKAQWAKLNKLVAEHTKDLGEMGYRVRVPQAVKARAVA